MSTIMEALNPSRLQELEMLSRHFANLRVMAKLGVLIPRMRLFAEELATAHAELCEYEADPVGAELKAAKAADREDGDTYPTINVRGRILSHLQSWAKAATDESSVLAKICGRASPSLRDSIGHIDNALHSAKAEISGLIIDETRIASRITADLLPPLRALILLSEELKDEARTAAGLKFDWRTPRIGVVHLILLAVFGFVGAHWFDSSLGQADVWQAEMSFLVFLVGFSGALVTAIALFVNVTGQVRTIRRAAAMIATGQLPADMEQEARDNDAEMKMYRALQQLVAGETQSEHAEAEV